MLTLVGDFGGTNCRMGLARGGQVDVDSQRSYANADFDTPEQALTQYLRDVGGVCPRAVCLGVAGPVQGDQVALTNYPWQLEVAKIRQAIGAKQVMFLNDLQAQGYALHGLNRSELDQIAPGQDAGDRAVRLIIAIGTGINAAVAHRQDVQIFVPPSESGHMALPLQDESDLAFGQAVREELGHMPVEAALSGVGLARLWAFFNGPPDQNGQAVMQAVAQGDAAAEQALRRFTQYLARYAADLALVHLPMGGIYLAGSVGLAVAPYMDRMGFVEAFHRRGPYASIHRAIPVFSVPKGQLTLRGCATRVAQGLA